MLLKSCLAAAPITIHYVSDWRNHVVNVMLNSKTVPQSLVIQAVVWWWCQTKHFWQNYSQTSLKLVLNNKESENRPGKFFCKNIAYILIYVCNYVWIYVTYHICFKPHNTLLFIRHVLRVYFYIKKIYSYIWLHIFKTLPCTRTTHLP